MRLALVYVILLSLASSATAQRSTEQRPGFWELLTADRVVTAVFHQMMSYARVGADVRYDAMSVDAVGGTLRVVGLEITPLVPYAAADACTIRAAHTTLRSSGFDRIDVVRGQITLDKALIDFDCLPPDVRPMLGIMNIGDIAVDRLNLDVTYDLPSGGADVQMQLGVEDMLTILVSAKFDYLSFRMDLATGQSQPAAHLNALQIQIEDAGLSDQLRVRLPAEMVAPDAMEAQARDIVTGILSPLQSPLSEKQTRFVSQAAEMARNIAGGAKRVVIETNISDAPVILSETRLQTARGTVFDALSPSIRPLPKASTNLVLVDILARAQNGDFRDDRQRLSVGRALVTGIGAPRNLALGLDILAPLIEKGNSDAARLAAQATLLRDPKRSYGFARLAAAGGDGKALGLMDQAEDKLSFDDVLAAQATALQSFARNPTRFGSVAEMRRAAVGHMIGLGAPRSYEVAYFWAGMAAAAGDVAADSLRSELADRMRKRGLSIQWAAVTDALDTEILDGWISADIPTLAAQD